MRRRAVREHVIPEELGMDECAKWLRTVVDVPVLLTREENIRRRAYEIYLERGGEPGHDLEDWLQAEREFTAAQSQAAGE